MKFSKTSFAETWARASKRKGGEAALQSLVEQGASEIDLANVPNDRVLSLMTKCVFRAGFNWKVIENKWAGFEDAFLGFVPEALIFQPDEFWDDLASNKAIVRHGAKIRSARDNAQFVLDISSKHESFGKFLKHWPDDNVVDLWAVLSKRGSRLGGNTGRYFLRFMGKDCFLPSRDTVAAVRIAGVDVPAEPKAKRDLIAMQEQFKIWHEETGLPFRTLSRICAMSAGDNIEPGTLAGYVRSSSGVPDA
ncbi:MAG: DNA-3-methyladenine glycosylase I [Hyphomicrobiales bacterium]